MMDKLVGIDISYEDASKASRSRDLLKGMNIRVGNIRTTFIKDTRTYRFGFTFYEDRDKVYKMLEKEGLR